MEISAALVKELRERTDAGMMECKKALVQTNGDIDAAIELMRKSGQAKADKKSGRVTAEGIIQLLISKDNKQAVILEINCETDFVARDENFIKFAQQTATTALNHKAKDTNELNTLPTEEGMDIEHARRALISKISENINVRRLQYMETNESIGSYLHGTKIGVLVQVTGGDNDLRKDLAMHIAANNPIVVDPKDVPAETIAKEREIYLAQAQASGKPQEIISKMVDGRIKKYLDEVSLLGQPFVKNPDITVAKLLQEKSAKVINFVRFAVGEGIEKEVSNFADEVMAQVKSSSEKQ